MRSRGPPRRGELLEVEIDSLAFGGRGVARADGLRRLRRRCAAGRPRARRGHQVEAPLRRGAGGRAAASPAPTASPTAASTTASPAPGRPGRACPTSASSPTSRSRSATRCGGSAASTASSWSEIEPAVETVALPQQARVLLRREQGGEAILGFHARGRWDLIVDVEDCLLASERGNAARNEVREWARFESIAPYDRRGEGGRPAQPGGPRGSADRPDPDPPRHLARPTSPSRRSTSTP